MMKQDPLAVPGLQHIPRGSIVNTASILGLSALGGLSTYNSSKHGVVSMTWVDARQFAGDGIRINCVCPGLVDTPMLRATSHTPEDLATAKNQSPIKRFIDASEIADAVIFLSGRSASAITGISLPVDGGALLYHII
jgi:NAD(P)-dependent dehydrogenase (short-subunit alcohol dehydrogenase family)